MQFGKQKTQRRFLVLFGTATRLARSIIYFNYERFMEILFQLVIGIAVSILSKFLIAASHSS